MMVFNYTGTVRRDIHFYMVIEYELGTVSAV